MLCKNAYFRPCDLVNLNCHKNVNGINAFRLSHSFHILSNKKPCNGYNALIIINNKTNSFEAFPNKMGSLTWKIMDNLMLRFGFSSCYWLQPLSAALICHLLSYDACMCIIQSNVLMLDEVEDFFIKNAQRIANMCY